MTDPRSESGLLHDRSSDTIHHHLGPVKDPTYSQMLASERAQQDRERIRLLYVACTRAEELLVVPALSAGNPGWFGLLDLGLGDLPLFDYSPYDTDLPPGVADVANGQDRDRFAAEAERIVQSTRTIKWQQPSRHEMSDEDFATAGAVAAVIVEEDIGNPEVQGGPLRGTTLHKLMEEVLTGETADDVNSLEIRATELVAQLGELAVEDPAKGLAPKELAQVVVNTLALPEVSALRDRLCAEFTVFGHQTDPVETLSEVAVSGISDAVTLGSGGGIEVVVDWKSDVNPDSATRQKYRIQVRDYLEASGASRGLVVYLTLGQVEKISAG